MARTERVAASDDRDAMVTEDRCTTTVTSSDVRQYLAADALFSAVGGHDPMPFWKSAPYLAHFMHGYKFNELVDEAMSTPDRMVDALQRHDSAFLKAATLRSWGSIDPGHAKLRELVGELIGEGLWRLLWMPPTLPYWPLEGPFEGKEQATKRLLFSAWNVVPDVVSAVLSYEAERLMTGGRLDSYEKPDEQQRPLLRLTQSTSGVLSRHRLLLRSCPACHWRTARIRWTRRPERTAGPGCEPEWKTFWRTQGFRTRRTGTSTTGGNGRRRSCWIGICRPSCVRGVTASFTRGRTASLCRSPIRRSSVSTSTIYSRSIRELSAGVLQISRTCSPTSPSARRPFSRHAV